jgi:signal transduction histidine kinase
VYTYNNIQNLVNDQELVAHTNDVLFNMEKILSEVRDSENAQRGYLISLNEEFLENYWGGRHRTLNRLDEARSLTLENVSQQMKFDSLASLINYRFDLMDERIKMGSRPPDVYRSSEVTQTGMGVMEKISGLIERMKKNEVELLKYRKTNASDTANTTYLISGIFTVLTIVIILISFSFTLNEFQGRARTEKLLNESVETLRVTNENLEQFAYVASHDLQEPLRKIQAFGDLLKSDFANDLKPQAVDYIDRMHTAAERMQILINDLLNFSRASRNVGEYEEISLRDKINHVLNDLEITIRQSHTTVDLDIPGDIKIYGAKPQLSRLFQNLITNGIKFRKKEEDPVIKIIADVYNSTANEYEFDLDPSRQYVEIHVIDNGIGFDEKYTDKIFTIFQRLHNKMDYKGTGIGLALCKKIVENHGGFTTAKSTPGVGSNFIIVLPTK